jgi:hypothetical protein
MVIVDNEGNGCVVVMMFVCCLRVCGFGEMYNERHLYQ